MDIDEIIIKTFSENQNICFPIYCQREAKSFVKILFKNGINGLIFSQEIGESETNFTSWKNGLSKLGIGRKVMKRINKPIEDFLWSDGELSEFEKELKTEVDKIKSMKNKKTEINRRIELGRSPTTKTVFGKFIKRERRRKLNGKTISHSSFDDSYWKSLSCQVRNVENEEKHLFTRNFQRGISWTGPEKEINQEFVEDFKAIKLRKTGRIDLLETNGTASDSIGLDADGGDAVTASEENSIRSKEDYNSKHVDDKSVVMCVHVLDENHKQNLDEGQEPVTTSDFVTKIQTTIATAEISQKNSGKSETETSEGGLERGRSGTVDSSVDYLYVFSDSNSCNSSPVKSHRFKIGVASCPYEELKKASEFNVDIKLISATAVKNPYQAMERVQGELQTFLMKGRENWYYCSLAKVLQTTSEAISWASNNSRHL